MTPSPCTEPRRRGNTWPKDTASGAITGRSSTWSRRITPTNDSHFAATVEATRLQFAGELRSIHMRIKLNEEDVTYSAQIAAARFSTSRKKGIVDRANSYNPDKVGALGEVAFGKLIGQRPEMRNTADGGIDYTFDGLNIDVKSVTKTYSKWLILTNQGPRRAGTSADIHAKTDVWVLMRPTTDNYDEWDALGWCNREDALSANEAPISKDGMTNPLGICAKDLRPMEELIHA